MMSPLALLLAALPGAFWPAGCSRPTTHDAVAANQQAAAHEAVGVIRSFGPDRAFVRIAHEDIPGYMKAMTMIFEPRDATQLAGLAEQDAVAFSFTEEPDGRYLLVSIRKR
jgi:Cu/Ag efflux protein CusF